MAFCCLGNQFLQVVMAVVLFAKAKVELLCTLFVYDYFKYTTGK